MRLNRSRLLITCALPLLLLAAATSPGVTPQVAEGSFRQDADSPIQITRVLALSNGPTIGGPRDSTTSWECVFFKNVSQQTIKHVRFIFWRETPQSGFIASSAGALDTLDLSGELKPGESVSGWPSGAAGGDAYVGDPNFGPSACRGTRDYGNIIAEVRIVDYPDGTQWVPLGFPDGKGNVYESFEPAPASSSVHLTNAYLSGNSECVSYATDERAVDALYFVYSWTDLTGQTTGEEVGGDPLHVPIRQTDPLGTSCRDVDTSGRVADVVLSGIRYVDGTLWSAVPAVPGVVGAPNAAVNVTSVATYAGVAPMALAHSGSQGLYACADVTNISQRAIKHFQMVFSHLAAGGSTLAKSDALDVDTMLAPGATAKANCRMFNAQIDPSVYHYALAASAGKADATPPTIYSYGKRATLSASVTKVDFTTGSNEAR